MFPNIPAALMHVHIHHQSQEYANKPNTRNKVDENPHWCSEDEIQIAPHTKLDENVRQNVPDAPMQRNG